MKITTKPHGTHGKIHAFPEINHTVDGGNPTPGEVGSLSHYLQGLIHPRWCRISAINSRTIEGYKRRTPWQDLRSDVEILRAARGLHQETG